MKQPADFSQNKTTAESESCNTGRAGTSRRPDHQQGHRASAQNQGSGGQGHPRSPTQVKHKPPHPTALMGRRVLDVARFDLGDTPPKWHTGSEWGAEQPRAPPQAPPRGLQIPVGDTQRRTLGPCSPTTPADRREAQARLTGGATPNADRCRRLLPAGLSSAPPRRHGAPAHEGAGAGLHLHGEAKGRLPRGRHRAPQRYRSPRSQMPTWWHIKSLRPAVGGPVTH